jgi:Flp pilus assembly protein TadG
VEGGIVTALRHLVDRLRRDHRGVFVVELALAAPVLIGLALSGVEVTRYVLLTQKMERAAMSAADLASQAVKLHEADIANLFDAVGFSMQPFDFSKGGLSVSAVGRPSAGGDPTVYWQRSYGTVQSSAFGGEGAVASLPAGFALRPGETIIATEVFMKFEPALVFHLTGPADLRSSAVYRPRFSSLATLYP